MPSAGTLIWISCRPLLKMTITTLTGFWLAKKDLFGNIAARGAGQVILNVMLPCLLFSRIVTSFKPENVRDLGPLILIDVLYQLIGFLEAWIIKQCFWVPHRFRNGILAAGIWSNIGDVPTAVVMSLTAAAPFNPATDSDLAVAYIAVFILIFYITLFPLGGSRLIESDFEGPDLDDDEVRESSWDRLSRKFRVIHQHIFKLKQRPNEPRVNEGQQSPEKSSQLTDSEKGDTAIAVTLPVVTRDSECQTPSRPSNNRRVSFYTVASDNEARTEVGQTVFSAGDTVVCTSPIDDSNPAKHSRPITLQTGPSTTLGTSSSHPNPRLRSSLRALRTFIAPPTLSIVIAFPVALIPSLKALFVEVPSSQLPNAPDGKPILYFIYDTAVWVGNGSVPLSLVCLGAALATLKVPRPFTRLPLGSIISLVIFKMLVTPVLGILIVQGLTYGTNLIRPEDKVLRFVCMFFSCVPTATTQVILTQVYSPDGTIGHLSAYLLPQYAIMFMSMTAVTAYALTLLF